MALLIRGPTDVDLDKPDLRLPMMCRDPGDVNERLAFGD
jgi:hypothetical protein